MGLSMDAVACLERTGRVPYKYILDREILCGSLQQLLYGSLKGTESYTEFTKGNRLRSKLEFIESVFGGWIQGGGIGCLSDLGSYEWNGFEMADTSKNDWVSVGRCRCTTGIIEVRGLDQQATAF
jgi:myosin-1